MKPSPSPRPALTIGAPRLTRVEAGFIIALFLVGAGLRCAEPARMAIEHFDEGVYASNVWFDAEYGFHYPAQHLYAPPLLSIAIESVMWLFGPSNLGAMAPSLVAGCLTIPLVWWVGRAWFGPTAGVASATLAALSDAHIVFSRTALTDVLLCFWMLLAVYFIWRALLEGGQWLLVAAGTFTALAWWTKYNGWLPLAIGGAGLVPWCLLSRSGRTMANRSLAVDFGSDHPAIAEMEHPRLKQAPTRSTHGESKEVAPAKQLSTVALRWIAIAAVAIVAWSPWLWSLQSTGGYSAVAANHRGYLVGLGGWLDACLTQFENLTQLEGTAGQHAPLAAFVAATLWMTFGTHRFTWNTLAGSFDTWLAIGLLVALSALLRGWLLTGVVGALGLMATLAVAVGIEAPEIRRRVRLGAWMLTAWFSGLMLTTPLYTPFPRLTLPWIMASWLAGGLGTYLFVSFLGQIAVGKQASATGLFHRVALLRGASPYPRSVFLFGAVGLALAGISVCEAALFRQGSPAWQTRTGVMEEAARILEVCRSSTAGEPADREPFVIYTLGEPALLYQLRLAGAELVRPIATLELAHAGAPVSPLKSFVAIGEQALRTRGFDEDFETARARLTLVRDGCLDPSLVVRLDSRDVAPSMGVVGRDGDLPPCLYRIALYRLR